MPTLIPSFFSKRFWGVTGNSSDFRSVNRTFGCGVYCTLTAIGVLSLMLFPQPRHIRSGFGIATVGATE
jgi:hypothetical protein